MSQHAIIAAIAFACFLIVAAVGQGLGGMASARDRDPLLHLHRRMADKVGLGRIQRAIEPAYFRLVIWVARLLAVVLLAVTIWHVVAAIISN